MRYTKYTDECCRVIEDAQEYNTDQYLVRLVRLHRITDRIRRTVSLDESDPFGSLEALPLGVCIRAIEVELQQIKSFVSRSTVKDCM